ncbi:MAG: radical SAM protein [Elusimicrobia bacterium]|nr:radical SAM protein [Elusimicrobiota bacterium]
MDQTGLRGPAVLAYAHRGAAYLNITDRCPVACVFCAKRTWRWRYHGWDLRLGAREPSAAEALARAKPIIEQLRPREAVFCGFGEPTSRLAVVLETARLLRAARPQLRLRLNTIGLGDLINGRAIDQELSEVLDAVSVSLNTADPEQWLALHRPRDAFAGNGFASVLSFISACVDRELETTVTAVDLPGVRVDEVRRLAKRLGARFRLRPELRVNAARLEYRAKGGYN